MLFLHYVKTIHVVGSCGSHLEIPEFIISSLYCGRYSVSFVSKDAIPPDQYSLEVSGRCQILVVILYEVVIECLC